MDQLVIPATVAVSKEINGIEMGVLDDGTAYLTERGVARLCGVAPSTIQHQRSEWSAGTRNTKFTQKLVTEGYSAKELYIPIKQATADAYAYPETVCMAFLDYYGFEAQTPNVTAQQNLRKLARAGLRLFVYSAVGYDPQSQIPPEWRQFHDRVMLVTAPIGHFSVFKEISEIVIAAIRGGLPCDDHTIPDISMGKTWANYWTENDLESQYGPRIRHEHNYPDYFPQARSNPQDIWVYPVAALGAFRTWLHMHYLPEKFPRYLNEKVRKGVLPASSAELLIAHSTPPEKISA